MSSRLARTCCGFTLLELTIAMTFVAVLVGGIALSISTCLNVWRKAQETAETNQEARAILELLARDVRGAYLGLHRTGGYFIGGSGANMDAPGENRELLEFSTESSSMARAALLPEPAVPERLGELQPTGLPVTDFVAVRYEMRERTLDAPEGLYRFTWVAPAAEWLEQKRSVSEAVSAEMISPAVTGVRLRYFDGQGWLSSWMTTEDNLRLPGAVAMELRLLDARENEHVYRTVVPIASR